MHAGILSIFQTTFIALWMCFFELQFLELIFALFDTINYLFVCKNGKLSLMDKNKATAPSCDKV